MSERKLQESDTPGLLNLSLDPSTSFTKNGNIRKRKKFDEPLCDRLKKKAEEKKESHFLKPPCEEKVCKKACVKYISEEMRRKINEEFWRLSDTQRKAFVLHHVTANPVSERKAEPKDEGFRKQKSIKYYLKNEKGTAYVVCKTFFLTTLGFSPSNDRMIRNVLQDLNNCVTPPKHKNSGKEPKNKMNSELIKNHILSFRPDISHYRREHAPNRLYLPSDLTFVSMHADYLKKIADSHEGFCSYDRYRKEAKAMNIAIVHLGNEECEVCEQNKLHSHADNNNKEGCQICAEYANHKLKAEEARKQYREDAENKEENTIVYSADLEKVVMLPRLEMFKTGIFTHRLTTYNESFVPAGKNSNEKTIAVIWHDAIAGRSKHEIISTFYYFLLSNRYVKNVILWLDNCSSQNKNWGLFSSVLYVINSPLVDTEKIILRYFQSGHTFMSADSYHHRVELMMKRAGSKIYNFDDYLDCARKAAEKIDVKVLGLDDLYLWEDYSSQYALSKINPRPYLQDMVEVTFKKNNNSIFYKTDFQKESQSLNFLNKSVSKSLILSPPKKIQNFKGIEIDRKKEIIKNLGPVIPPEKLLFWEQLQAKN